MSVYTDATEDGNGSFSWSPVGASRWLARLHQPRHVGRGNASPLQSRVGEGEFGEAHFPSNDVLVLDSRCHRAGARVKMSGLRTSGLGNVPDYIHLEGIMVQLQEGVHQMLLA